MVIYSFNRVTVGGLQLVSFTWNGFTRPVVPRVEQPLRADTAFWLSIRLSLISHGDLDGAGDPDRHRARALPRAAQFRGKGVVEQVLFLNIAAPEIVMGASLLGLFVTFNVARGFLTLGAGPRHVLHRLRDRHRARAAVGLRPVALEEAAHDLGAGPLTTFRLVTLPLIMPGVLAGALMAFALSIDDFVTSNFVAGNAVPFPVWIYGASRVGTPPQVFVFGTVIFLVGLAFALASLVLARKEA